MLFTATITARGADSTVPDNAGAVDADIFRDGVKVGEVTLLPDGRGFLTTWGSHVDHWASYQLQQAIDLDEHRAAILDAVNAAAE